MDWLRRYVKPAEEPSDADRSPSDEALFQG